MGRIVVIGAGIAGLSVAAFLARRGRQVVVLEQESKAGQHSSGHSAAIFRLTVPEPINVRLALRTRALGAELVRGGIVWETGGWYPLEDAANRRAILAASEEAGVVLASRDRLPAYLAHRDRPALWSPRDGLIDVAKLLAALESTARRHGADLRFGVAVEALDRRQDRVEGVIVNGERLPAELVIDATGAFSPELPGATHDVGIRPHRRHVFVLEGAAAASVSEIAWDLTDEVYVRPHGDTILACACDEEPLAATRAVTCDPRISLDLKEKLSRWAPPLAAMAIVRSWAGLRPLTADHRFVVGPDPVVAGLFRLGGFGGHGMTAGLAAGELAADLIEGRERPDARELRPGR
jgi:glycine/D-amino acid oxidase-like deaminating enzyme